jgi:LysR family positive regulator for ilvC
VDRRSLEVFLAVDESLSFTQTASRLHMSVSAVSRCIQRLEEEVGCCLFERNRRSMSATGATSKLRPLAEKILADWRELQHVLREGTPLSGDLRVFCSVTATHRLLSPLLAAYREACPGVNLLLQTGDQANGLEQVQRGAADIAMIARPGQLPPAIEFLPLTDSPLRLCLPRMDCAVSQPFCGRRGEELLEVLHEVPWILPERGVSKELIEDWLAARLPVQPRIYARVAGHEAIAAMIALGLGIGILPELVVAASGVADGVELHALPSLPPMAIGLCARRSRLDDPLVSSLWTVGRDQASRVL